MHTKRFPSTFGVPLPFQTRDTRAELGKKEREVVVNRISLLLTSVQHRQQGQVGVKTR